jgi:hypothetical protein
MSDENDQDLRPDRPVHDNRLKKRPLLQMRSDKGLSRVVAHTTEEQTVHDPTVPIPTDTTTCRIFRIESCLFAQTQPGTLFFVFLKVRFFLRGLWKPFHFYHTIFIWGTFLVNLFTWEYNFFWKKHTCTSSPRFSSIRVHLVYWQDPVCSFLSPDARACPSLTVGPTLPSSVWCTDTHVPITTISNVRSSFESVLWCAIKKVVHLFILLAYVWNVI